MADTILRDEQELLNEISSSRLIEYTSTIAQWVRLSGSEDERKAFDYVKSVLDGFGITTQLLEHDAYISLPVDASLQVEAPEEFSLPCITHSMSVSTPPGGVAGELIYVGRGTEDELAGLDLAGKIVLTDGLTMPVRVKALENRGALGQIFIHEDQMYEMIISTVWGSPTKDQLQLLPQTPVVSIRRQDGERLKALASGQSVVKVSLRTKVDTGWRKTPLLIADIPGNGSDDYVLFSGHIDSWHYGAMDNATANATMLELAGLFAKRRQHLRRGLRLAFWSGHSHGRYSGSAWYADEYWQDLYDNCVVHVNIDSVGAKGANILTEANVMSETKPLAYDVIKALTGQEISGNRVGRAGDQSFWGIGIPSLFILLSEQELGEDATSKSFALLMGGGGKTGGPGWWWHTPEDTLDKIDPDNLRRDTQVYGVALHRLLTAAVLPLDYRETVAEINGLLEEFQSTAGRNFDASMLVAQGQKLAEAVDRLYKLVEDRQPNLDDELCLKINECLKHLGRQLVPLLFTKEDPFDQDLAVHLPKLPVLAPFKHAAALAADSDDVKFMRVGFARVRNRVNFNLVSALRAVQQVLSDS